MSDTPPTTDASARPHADAGTRRSSPRRPASPRRPPASATTQPALGRDQGRRARRAADHLRADRHRPHLRHARRPVPDRPQLHQPAAADGAGRCAGDGHRVHPADRRRRGRHDRPVGRLRRRGRRRRDDVAPAPGRPGLAVVGLHPRRARGHDGDRASALADHHQTRRAVVHHDAGRLPRVVGCRAVADHPSSPPPARSASRTSGWSTSPTTSCPMGRLGDRHRRDRRLRVHRS